MADPWRGRMGNLSGLNITSACDTYDAGNERLDNGSFLASFAIYPAIMVLVLLPLLPCWSWWHAPGEEKEMEQRKAKITEGLITKKVLCHGQSHISNLEEGEESESTAKESKMNEGKESELTADESSYAQSDEESIGSLQPESNTCTDDTLPQCAICLEPYSVGDEVSWSKGMCCNHAYHKKCIIQWLLKHDECPECRSAYLYRVLADRDNIARKRTGASNHYASHGHEQSKKKGERCKFCVFHGLVDPSGDVHVPSDERERSDTKPEDGAHKACGDLSECSSLEVDMGNEEHGGEHENNVGLEHCAPDLEMGNDSGGTSNVVISRP